MNEGWFVGIDAGDTAAGAQRICERRAETPQGWPALAVELRFVSSEAAYYDALGAATRETAKAAAAESESADDKQLIHAVRGMDDKGTKVQ